MTEEEAHSRLEEIQNWLRSKDILYTETKFGDGNGEHHGFAEEHIRRIKRESDDKWDPRKAELYILTLKDNLSDEHGRKMLKTD